MADTENPMVVDSDPFLTDVHIPTGVNETGLVGTYAPPSYAEAVLVVNDSAQHAVAEAVSPSAIYLKGADMDNDEECPICLGAPTRIVARPACGHWFHPECLLEWLDRSKGHGCPICETSIGTEIVMEDQVPQDDADIIP